VVGGGRFFFASVSHPAFGRVYCLFCVSCQKSTTIYHNRCALFVLTVLAWMFSIVAVTHCTFLLYSTSGGLLPGQVTQQKQGWGLWTEAVYDPDSGELRGCLKYNDTQVWSGMQLKAKYLGAIVAAFLSLVFVVVSAMFLFVGSPSWQKCLLLIVRIFLPLAFILSGFMFGFFTNANCNAPDAKCVPGPAGIVASINCAVIFVLCVLAYLVTIPPHPYFVPYWKENDPVKHVKERPVKDDDDEVPMEQAPHDDSFKNEPEDDPEAGAIVQYSKKKGGGNGTGGDDDNSNNIEAVEPSPQQPPASPANNNNKRSTKTVKGLATQSGPPSPSIVKGLTTQSNPNQKR